MTITINGEPREVAAGLTVGELIVALTGSVRGSAVAVDGEVVPRSEWDRTALQAGQQIELITAKQGG
jgi:sulfur carrier protein